MAHHRINPPSGLAIYHRGAPLKEGPLPALFYFALSGRDSLFVDPFNQPSVFLADSPIRVYSSSLPCHGIGLKNSGAISRWAKEIQHNHNIISEFVDRCRENIDFLIKEGYIDASKIAVAGLSRGGVVATHLAAHDSRVTVVLEFAPITRFSTILEFRDLLKHPIVKSLNLDHVVEKLINKKIRFYIGNRDIRVGTEECFGLIRKLVEVAHHHKIRSPNVELIISPSIGHKGHGTPPHIFQDGANWLLKQLQISR